jgi:hypothetical protein
VITMLHDTNGALAEKQRRILLGSADRLKHFVSHDLMELLRAEGKLKLAMFFDQLRTRDEFLYSSVILPLLKYRQELMSTRSVIFSGSERFQYKLLSTGKTFARHSDWGGTVGLVGEFDQIRLRYVGHPAAPAGIPAIIEFKSGLGRKSIWDTPGSSELSDWGPQQPAAMLEQPGVKHAFQLMIYWLAFQTLWDLREHVEVVKGRCVEIPMPLQQQPDLILYNLFDASQYQLVLTDQHKALQALISCIFCLDWAMKNGYVQQMPGHHCQKTALFNQLPSRTVPVGSHAISAEECYRLARDTFTEFQTLISWQKVGPGNTRTPR